MECKKIPWSNNWWIENGKAWFCAGETSTLLCTDMKSGKCEFVAQIPDCDKIRFNKYPYCIKYKDCVFCLPYLGKSMWCYNVVDGGWEEIQIANESYLTFFPISYQQDASSVWLLEEETGKFFEVNLKNRMLKTCLHASRDYGGEYVLVQDKLYCTCGYEIYCIDVLNGKCERYEVPNVKDEIYTICYDGVNFWLGGCYKEIYIWNQKEGTIKTITEFPEQFGFYHFKRGTAPYLDCDSIFNPEYTLFSPSLSVGKYIWYISCRSNGIIYVDKSSYKVFYLDIEDEQETRDSIDENLLGYKFQLEYVRENRYIGLYSLKNHWIFEIDTVDLCVKRRNYELDSQAVLYMAEASGYCCGQYIFSEGRERDRIVFNTMTKTNSKKGATLLHSVGKQIYRTLE